MPNSVSGFNAAPGRSPGGCGKRIETGEARSEAQLRRGRGAVAPMVPVWGDTRSRDTPCRFSSRQP